MKYNAPTKLFVNCTQNALLQSMLRNSGKCDKAVNFVIQNNLVKASDTWHIC